MDEIQKHFLEKMKELEEPDSCFLAADFTSDKFCIELSYPRKTFINDINKILNNLPSEDRNNVTTAFNFVVENDILNGCPELNDSANKDINECVKNFIFNNKISIKENSGLADCIECITKALPEFIPLIGKVQHHTHDYTVDIHTLKVLQGVVSDPRFNLLNNNDKKVLKIAILLHDLTKKECEIDKTHPQCSANAAQEILKRFDMEQSIKDRIVLIIRQHDWLERYNKGLTPAAELASVLKDGNNFLMECILAKADLIAVQKSEFFYEKFKDVLLKGEKEISLLINKGFYAA